VRANLMKLSALFVFCLGFGWGNAWAADAAIPKVALTNFELISNSQEPTTDAERARMKMLRGELEDLLTKSGRFQIVPLSPELQKKVDARPNIPGCGGCQYEWGREAGVDQVIWVTVQKVSNLILNINVYIDDVNEHKPLFGTSVDIRSNTDESWQRGIRFLVKYNILNE